MTYNADQTWATLSNEAGRVARQMQGYMRESQASYNEWQNFRNSRTDAQIATDLGKTETEIAELDSCYAAFQEIFDFADNVASPVQGDRFYSMRKFS